MGTYPLTLPDHVMAEAKRAAVEDKVSLNELLSAFIAVGLVQRLALLDLKKRAALGNVDVALEILDRIPNVAPDPGDELT